MHASREGVAIELLLSDIENLDLGLGHTAAIARLDVRLVLDVTRALPGTCSTPPPVNRGRGELNALLFVSAALLRDKKRTASNKKSAARYAVASHKNAARCAVESYVAHVSSAPEKERHEDSANRGANKSRQCALQMNNPQ